MNDQLDFDEWMKTIRSRLRKRVERFELWYGNNARRYPEQYPLSRDMGEWIRIMGEFTAADEDTEGME